MGSLSRFGLMFEPQEGMPPDELLGWAEYAEKSGYGHVFRSDHLLPTSKKPGLSSLECWSTLGAIAVKTRRIEFGPMVSPIGFRNPALLARMACTVHSLSKGRLRLGVGAGWYGEEYLSHGYEFPDIGVRQAQFREALQIIAPLVRGERVDFDGRHFSAHTDALPKPRSPIHLIIGGRGRRTVRAAADFGDEWNAYSPSLGLFRSLKTLLDSRARRRVEVSQMAPFVIAENSTDLEARVKRFMRRRGASGSVQSYLKELKANSGVIAGTADGFVSQLNERIELGIEKFYFQVLDTSDRQPEDLLTDTLRTRL